MKCLSIQQPWASLICGGLKDVENRSWRVKDAPGRILIHAGKTMQDIEFPEFFAIAISNALNCGYIPVYEDMPRGVILGYADVVGFTQECTSDWAQEGPKAVWKWQLENAKLFKEPIPYKGRQGLFEVPEIDEDNLPEVFDFTPIEREGTILHLPLCAEMFDGLNSNDTVAFYLTQNNQDFFVNNKLEPLPTEKVIFHNSQTGQTIEREAVSVEIEDEFDENGKPISFFSPDGDELWLYSVYIVYK